MLKGANLFFNIKGNAGVEAHAYAQASCLNLGSVNGFRHVLIFLEAEAFSVFLLKYLSKACGLCWRQWPTCGRSHLEKCDLLCYILGD